MRFRIIERIARSNAYLNANKAVSEIRGKMNQREKNRVIFFSTKGENKGLRINFTEKLGRSRAHPLRKLLHWLQAQLRSDGKGLAHHQQISLQGAEKARARQQKK